MTTSEDFPAPSIFSVIERAETVDGVQTTALIDGEIVVLSPSNLEVLQEFFQSLARGGFGEVSE